MRWHVIDFETEAIEDRPNYPPEPVGVAIQLNSGRAKDRRYLAWGHPTENNCTKAQARRELMRVWREPLLFHNAAFDVEVACAHMNMPTPMHWDDTLLMAYLHDPRDASLSLKPLAAKYLNMPPDEQEELRDWIIENYMKPRKLRKFSQWGAYIAKAPGRLVGKYAVGDVVRTDKLGQKFWSIIREAGMAEAYEREHRIIAVKLDMESPGIRVAPKLKRDQGNWHRAAEGVERKIKRRLRAPRDFNLDSPKQLAEILLDRGKLDKVVKTKKGSVSTKRDVLEENCNDPLLVQLLSFRSVLSNYLGTFIDPWVESYDRNSGLIYPTYNTVRSTNEYGGTGGRGTRTGRFSSSRPNFQNIPADVEGSKHEELLLALQRYLREFDIDFVGLRDYIIPRKGCVFIAADYSQQELRILAHYEDDQLLASYLADPNLDVHDFIRRLIRDQLHMDYPRKFVKIVVFAIIYGKGVKNLAKEMGTTMDEAATVRNALLNAVPGIKDLQDDLNECCRLGQPIYTWGGRRYYHEEDLWIEVNGEWRRKKLWYKMLNLLIQGSAADATKQGMLNVVDNTNPEYFQLLVQVHDELLAEVPKEHVIKQGKLMRAGMEDLRFDVPMVTEAKIGARSWGRLTAMREW